MTKRKSLGEAVAAGLNLSQAEQFFYENSGSSWFPDRETEEQGKVRGAQQSAKSEAWARDAGYSYRWEVDEGSSSADWIAAHEDGGRLNNPWAVWSVVIINPEGKVVGSLGGVDFGRDGEPWGNNYRRVVEADLALEEMP